MRVRNGRGTVAAWVVFTMCAAGCSSSAQEQSPEVARIGDRVVTLQEIDDRWRTANPAQHAEVMQNTYDARRRVIDAMVAEMLLAEAARTSGLTVDRYEEAEILRRLVPVTPEDVRAFYDENEAELEGRPFDALAPRIQAFLENERRTEARQSLLADLQRSGPTVQITLEPPRRPVEIRATDPAQGDPSAPVTLVEFSDYECPYCLGVMPTLKRIREAYGDRVRLVWKDFPLTQIHPAAFKAAEAAHCAGDQDRYWEYHDLLFANQQALQPPRLVELAGELGLDTDVFRSCLDSDRHAVRVQEGVTQGTRLGVNSTPTTFINGRVLAGAHEYETFAAIIDEELSRAR